MERPQGVRRTLVLVPAALVIVAVVCVGLIGMLGRDTRYGLPDVYSYRAQIAAFAEGHVSLTESQYFRLRSELAARTRDHVPRDWNGIEQWRRTLGDRYVSEKNPGYALLAAPFWKIGAMNLLPLLFAAIGAGSVWWFARRWLGRWWGALAVILTLFSPLTISLVQKVFMPSFAEAMLAAAGISWTAWSIVAGDRSRRARTVAALAGIVLLDLCVLVRYTDAMLVVISAIALLAAAVLVPGTLSVRRVLAVTTIPTTITVVAIGLFNHVAYGSWNRTGYSLPVACTNFYRPGAAAKMFIGSRSISCYGEAIAIHFRPSALPLVVFDMAGPMLRAMPLAIVTLGVLSFRAIYAMVRWLRTKHVTHDPRTLVVGGFLIVSWLGLWALYSTYGWIATFASQAPPTTWIVAGRFFLDAAAPAALLAVWMLARTGQPRMQALRCGLGVALAAATIVLAFALV